MKRKTIRIKFELDIEVAEYMSESDIEFWLNESSWCGDNIVERLAEYRDKLNENGKCFCPFYTAIQIERKGEE